MSLMDLLILLTPLHLPTRRTVLTFLNLLTRLALLTLIIPLALKAN
jgi:hypothetical protein